jgi:tetratricopeptide (TPR) repeat protein/transglutaminase-like putative cysteine protease
MARRLSVFAAGMILASLSLSAQAPPAAPGATDYSNEAFVIEQSRATYRFENDGTGRRETYARIRIQSDAGVQQWGQLVFGFNAATERMDIQFVRVHKPDGTTVTASADAVQELTSPIEREAPIYTDFRQKHITVPSLRPGETLEFSIAVTVHTPLAAGQFWMEHDFRTASVDLDDQLEIDVPAGRAVTLKTAAGLTPQTSQTADRRIYRWTSSQKKPSAEHTKELQEQLKDEKTHVAGIRLTTFQNWAEVGRWYAGIERSSRAPDAQVRARAEQLVAAKTSNMDKLEALYDFVSLNFRYVSLSLGTGRYQPRAAVDVLRDQYGDCKDKHTLLASLMESVGLQASTVLINSEEKLDPEFPSPSQFDHVITRAEVDGQPVWLDVTAEVAPFRLLSPSLRKKQALVVDGNSGRLEDTPADPPFQNVDARVIDGRIVGLGTLKAHVTYTVRGDGELALRSVFRSIPSARWKEAVAQMNEAGGLGGEIGDFKVADPGQTRQPFTIEYDVTKAGFVDWTKKTVSLDLPMSSFELPEPDDPKDRIELGSPTQVTYRIRLELAPGYAARAPQSVNVTRDYGDYRSVYAVSGQVFTAERSLNTRAWDLAPERAADFAAFRRVVSADDDQRLALDVPASAAAAVTAPNSDLKPADLLRSASEALKNNNAAQAIVLLKRVVELEPRHQTAWLALGSAYLLDQDMDGAQAAFTKQVEINPFDEKAYTALGMIYMYQGRNADAEAAFKKQLEVNPLDAVTQNQLMQLYLQTKRFAEAIPLIERASAADNDNASLHVSRGYAYLNVGREQDAIAAFDRAIELEPTATIRNNVAYYLSEKGVRLDRAQQYAEAAVTATGVESRNLTLSRITSRELGVVRSLASYWDTLGWVLFAKGDLSRAEPLLKAAFTLSESGVVGDHLGQVYEKQGKKDQALRAYAMALKSERPEAETRDRLRALAGAENTDAIAQAHVGDAVSLRTVAVKPAGASGSAEFFVLLGTQGVEDVAFVSGDAALRAPAVTAAIKQADFRALLPVNDGVGAKIVRRGGLSCLTESGKSRCSFVLFPLSTTKPMAEN